MTLKGYSGDQSHFSEINVKLAEKNKYAAHSIQRSLEMCGNKEKPSVSEDFRYWRSEVTEVHEELKEVIKKIKQFQRKNS